MNYLDYFEIPKYWNAGKLPSTGNQQKDSELSHMQKLYKNEGLSTEWTPEAFLIEGAILGKPFEIGLKGLWKGVKYITPKITRRLKNVNKTPIKQLISENKSPTNIINKALNIPDYASPNYKGNYLELVKNRLSSGGYERIENPAEAKEFLLSKVPEQNEISNMSARPGVFYDTAKPVNFTQELAEELSRLWNRKITPLSLLDDYLNANNIYTAHEFEHFVHTPKVKLSDAVVDSRYIPDHIKYYFVQENNAEIAARFGQLKNYFGLREGQPITKEMWEYAKLNYIKDTGVNNNMDDFFNLHITDLQKFLDWGNKNALSIATPIGLSYGTIRNKSIQSSK